MIGRALTLVLLTCVLVVPEARTDEPSQASVEERLRRLELGFEQLRQVNEALLAENARLRAELEVVATEAKEPAVRNAGTSARLQMGGFIQVQGEAGDAVVGRIPDDSNRIFVRRARINASGAFQEDFDYRIEGEFAGTLGTSSALRSQMTDGYVTFTRWPSGTIRAGQFKTPYGFEQLYSDTKLSTPERSTVNDFLTPGRQLGVQLAGDLHEKRINYAIGAFNGNSSNTSGNDGDNFMVAARLSSFLMGSSATHDSLRFGIDGYTSEDNAVVLPSALGVDSSPATAGRDNLFAGTRTAWGVDSQFVAGRTELWAEYLATRFEPDNGIPSSTFTASGWYAQLGYFAIPGRLQFVGKYESTDPSDQVSNDELEVYWLGANWLLKSHDIKLQLFYGLDDGAGADGSGRVVARMQTMF